MIKLFKSVTIAYFITAFAGIAAFAFLMVPFIDFKLLFFVVPLAWIFACVMVFSVIASKKLDKYMTLLENCEARAYADELEKLLPKAKDDVTKNLLNLNLSAAYSDIGRDDFMAHYIFSVKITKKTAAPHKFVYHCNLFSHYIHIGELELAEKELENAANVLPSPKIKGRLKEMFAKHLELNKAELEMARGSFDGAEELFTASWNEAKTLREKVTTKYTLGKICEHYGRIDEARECYKFAVENGKGIRPAVEASERLAEIG